MTDPTFAREELTLLLMILGRYSQNSLSTSDGEIDRLMNKLNEMLQSAPRENALATCSESPGALATIAGSAIVDVETRSLLAEAGQALTSDDIAAVALNLRDGLIAQNDKLQARLDDLQDVEAIHRENERLTVELECHGAPDAMEEIELWKKRYDAADSENSALRVTNKKVSKALHDERVERMRADPKSADLANDPCRGPGIVQKPRPKQLKVTTVRRLEEERRSGNIDPEPPDIIFDDTPGPQLPKFSHQLQDDETPVEDGWSPWVKNTQTPRSSTNSSKRPSSGVTGTEDSTTLVLVVTKNVTSVSHSKPLKSL